ncbi:hypothetical protein [Streptomyces sp. NPDC059564]|uniref:hypothetical protein n=1 Tax=Streptomyces sp. NPDC059564 TaxID=3346865 RepID=UPI00368E13AA
MAVRTGERVEPARHRWAWWRAGAWALLGPALLALSAIPALGVPEEVATEKAFSAARPCGAREPAGARADCLRTTRATVLSAEDVKSGKATVFRVRLRPPVPAPADRPFDLDAAGALSERIEPGVEVEVTTWRDVQVSVSRDGTGETLPGLPDEKAAMSAGIALAGVWAAALALLAALGTARRARRSATGRPYAPQVRFGVAKGLAVLVVPLAAGFIAGRVADGWTAVTLTAASCALVAVPATLAALRWDRPRPSVTA